MTTIIANIIIIAGYTYLMVFLDLFNLIYLIIGHTAHIFTILVAGLATRGNHSPRPPHTIPPQVIIIFQKDAQKIIVQQEAKRKKAKKKGAA